MNRLADFLPMDLLDFKLMHERPTLETPKKGESTLVPYSAWLITHLIVAAPSQLSAELNVGDDTVSWHLRTFDPCAERIVDTIRASLFRPVLARLAIAYMEGCVYGGFRRFWLKSGIITHPVALYLGNDSLTGFWFRARCGRDTLPDETPLT